MTIPIRNTENRFGIAAILIHWLMALLIIGLLSLGLYMTRIPISAEKLKYFGWHKEFGVLVLMLVIVRLTWRLTNQLPTLAELPSWERMAARVAHWMFYGFMFLLPITGWLMTSAAGLPPSFFGLFVLPSLVPPSDDQRILFAEIHEWLAYGLIATLCMHVGATFKHYLIDRDQILQRMLKP
jgi:cytochrome b561